MSIKDIVEGIGNLFVLLWELVKGMYESEGFIYGLIGFFVIWFVVVIVKEGIKIWKESGKK